MSHQPPSSGSLSTEQRDLLKLLAHTYLRYGRAEKAAILLHAMHAVDPVDSHVVKSLAYAYVRSGRPHEAMLLLDRLLEGGDGAPEIHLLRSQAYSQMGRVADAARAMRHFVGARATLNGGAT
jgi:predicted Zn-dependent protease